MGSLVRALEVASKALLEPRWGQVRRAVQDEVDLRARTLLDGGVRALLESLPLARWHPPCWRWTTPVLVHAVTPRPLDTVAPDGGGLERLLGRTRATVLVQVAGGRTRTTFEVARAVGIALPSASHQLAVLRDGGLVASHREGQSVRHSVTSMGHRLPGADTGRRTETDPACGP
ncbi:ArsR family transcriptional regulator [Streptomyces sp. NBC_01515]|uniref:ArsR/SmtB family transcription factor n=1 Tax=Streptomyces sp. NBC_01515 TaxID=2903890 RepID=UPI003865DDDF